MPEGQGKESGKENQTKDSSKAEKTVTPPAPAQTTVQAQGDALIANISLWIDNYDDIFSDFDPRAYSERALSVDFLDEANRATRDKPSGQIVLKLLAPESKRNPEEETIIKKRLKDHFKKRAKTAKDEVNKLLKEGIAFSVVGLFLMISAAFVLFEYSETNLLTSFLIVFLEPAGWFFFWEGLGLVIFERKKLKPNLEFNEKMLKCEIVFSSY